MTVPSEIVGRATPVLLAFLLIHSLLPVRRDESVRHSALGELLLRRTGGDTYEDDASHSVPHYAMKGQSNKGDASWRSSGTMIDFLLPGVPRAEPRAPKL